MAKWGLFLGSLFALWFGGWFVAANWVDDKVGGVLASLQKNNITVDCPQREMRGFPFRMGLFCQSFAIDDQVHGYQVQLGEVRSAAQIYNPKENIIEFDGPAKFSTAGFDLTAQWQSMRTFFVAARGGFEGMSTNYRELKFSGAAGSLASKRGALHLRPTPYESGDPINLDVAVTMDKLFPLDDPSLEANFNVDAMLVDGYAAFIKRRERPIVWLKNKGEMNLRSAVLSLPDGGRLAFSGPMKINDDGTLTGKILVGMKNKDSLVRWASGVNPQFAPLILGLDQGMDILGREQTIGSEKVKAIEVSIKRSRVKVGFFEVGELPPLFD